MFTDANKFLGEGLTYDDVLLIPSYSEVLPREVDISTSLSKNIRLNIPIVSAAMDTVTESGMAIAMAQEGGIGVLHKNMSIEAQALQVRKVKRAENGMILDPVTLHASALVGDALAMMKEHSIGGIPVVNEREELVGIVTNRDLRFERDMARPVTEVMTHKVVTISEFMNFEKAEQILQEYKIDAIVIDTAHAHTNRVIEMARRIKAAYPNIDMVVGNIGTGEAAKDLAKAGADAVKVGIGPGSICTTRIIAGIGIPQLTAVYQVAKALKGTGIPVIADGGIRYTGDIVKALAAGASSIMAGSLFAGVDESPGETIIYEGRKFKTYRGMGSLEAMQHGSKDRYFQDMEDDIKKLVPEGIVGRVPYKGSLSEVIYQMTGGLRSGMGYTGSANIDALQTASFIKITSAGVTESHPHDVTIISEAPNYSR